MSDVLRWQTVKTRKDHKCPLCGRLIPKGSFMVVAAWADGGSVFSDRFCIPCERYWKEELNSEEVYFDGELIYGEDKETWDKIRREVEA
ncbi:MAG: hypothetical protein PHO15_08290 [Eubacteriales bacterium]|nr:hypothetical protein [Eubacteriales bacterium]